MTKNRRNYNQDHFKVGGSAQPGDEVLPEQDKHKLAQQGDEEAKRRKVPPGAPGTEPDAGSGS